MWSFAFIFRHLLPLVLILVVFTSAARGQIWSQVFGPTGGDVEAIASDRFGHIYAGTDSGAYVSTTNGASWSQINTGLANPEIFCFAVTSAGTILAGTEGGGIFRSTNFGQTWDSSSAGLPDSSNILSLASDGHGNLYAGHSRQGVFYSSDDGIHWVARNSGMESQSIFSLTVAPNGTVYAGTAPYIFSSTDQGQHWDTSLIAGPPSEEVLALAADSTGNIFMGTFRGSRWRLRAGSSTWEDISSFLSSGEIRTMATSGQILFEGLFGGGILESMNLGRNWAGWSSGLTDLKVYCLTVAPSGFVFAGTYLAEVFRTNFPLAVSSTVASKVSISLYPQPVFGNATVVISLPSTEPVQLEISDLLGNNVATLWNGIASAGSHSVAFDASHFLSGQYFIILHTSAGIHSIPWLCLH